MASERLPLDVLPIRPMLGLVARSARRLIGPHESWVGCRVAPGFAIGLAEALAANEPIQVADIKAARDRASGRDSASAGQGPTGALASLGTAVTAIGTDLLKAREPRDAGTRTAEPAADLQRRSSDLLGRWIDHAFLDRGLNGHEYWGWAVAALRQDYQDLAARNWGGKFLGPAVEALSPTWLGELWPRALATDTERASVDRALADPTSFNRLRRVRDGGTVSPGPVPPSDADILSWFVSGAAEAEAAARQVAALRAAWGPVRPGHPQLVAYVAGEGADSAALLADAGAIAHVGKALGVREPRDATELRYRLENSALNARAGWVGRPGDWYFADVRIGWRDPTVVATTRDIVERTASAPPSLAPAAFGVRGASHAAAVTTKEERDLFAAMSQQR